MSESKVLTVLGCNAVGEKVDEADFKVALLTFSNAGNFELDSANSYNDGKTDEILGRNTGEDIKISNKVNAFGENSLKPESIRKQFELGLKVLQRQNIDILYLHHPDKNTPIVDTLRAVNEFYTEGKLIEFGLSNFQAWQVADVYNICKENNWIRPTVYQGLYNAVKRHAENELFSCLRYYNIRFYAYCPLASGLLTGKYKYTDIKAKKDGRFWNAQWNHVYTDWFWKEEYFVNLEEVQKVIDEEYGVEVVSMTEASLRWLYNHSKLSGASGDKVILGFSKVEQIEENLKFSKIGLLTDNVVAAFERLWRNTSNVGLNDHIDL